MPYIDKKELLAKAKAKQNGVFAAPVILNLIEKAPEVDVIEVKHGEWEEYWDNDYMEYFHRCSKCKNDAPAKRDTYCDQVLTNYCPNCGAKMDLKEGAKK